MMKTENLTICTSARNVAGRENQRSSFNRDRMELDITVGGFNE